MTARKSLTLLLAMFAVFSARAATPPSSTQIDEMTLVQSFLPAKLVGHDLAGAGTLYCQAGVCQENARSDAERDLPDFLTSHTIQLGQAAPPLKLSCNGAGSLLCSVGPVGAAEPRTSQVLDLDVVDRLFVPGDGCLYTARADHADHLVRRMYCWKRDKLREQPQPMSYVGFRTVANVRLAVYATPSANMPAHYIPAGGFVEIIAALPDATEDGYSRWILVRDAFGITGLVSVKELGGNNACLSGRPLGIRGFCATGD